MRPGPAVNARWRNPAPASLERALDDEACALWTPAIRANRRWAGVARDQTHAARRTHRRQRLTCPRPCRGAPIRARRLARLFAGRAPAAIPGLTGAGRLHETELIRRADGAATSGRTRPTIHRSRVHHRGVRVRHRLFRRACGDQRQSDEPPHVSFSVAPRISNTRASTVASPDRTNAVKRSVDSSSPHDGSSTAAS